jgi:hypothetical protein
MNWSGAPGESQKENYRISEKINPGKGTAIIAIFGIGEEIIPPTPVKVKEGDTVLTATVSLLKRKKIPYDISGSGPIAYVRGIHHLYEFDRGPLSGWIFKKNGEIVGHSSGVEPVSPGDQIEWFFTDDYTQY